MTISLVSDAGGNSGKVQLNGSDVLTMTPGKVGGKGIDTIPASSTAGTLVASDKGKSVKITAPIIVPANVFAADDVVSIYNDSASALVITQAVGMTLRMGGTSSTGNRTLAGRGIVTLWFISATEAVITGAGLS